HFFDVAAGADLHLWQHVRWAFGHPEVYILILPAFGIISEVIPTFARKPLFGAPVMIYSGILIAFLGSRVWRPHMLASGMGPLLGIFAGLYYWWPKMTGRLLDERLGRLNFWTMFIGFNVAFFPQHFLGVLGMPRRIYTYHADAGWTLWNFVSTTGAFILALGI